MYVLYVYNVRLNLDELHTVATDKDHDVMTSNTCDLL